MSKMDMNKLMQQAQQMQTQMQQAQEEAANEIVEASAGGGMVTVKATGGGEIVGITIDPRAIDPDDPEMLADLVLAAVNEALRSASALMESKMQGMIPGGLGGLGLPGALTALENELDAFAAETAFSGVVRVDGADGLEVAKAYGLAHRGYEIPNAVDTRFATASVTKGLTALAVVSLIEEGLLDLSTPARSVLGLDLPLIDDDVTIEQLLAHRSGIGDYLDEDLEQDLADYLMPVSVHELADTEQYVAVLDGHPTKFAPGERFSYCNGGYVVLALIAERAAGVPYHDLVQRRVCEPAGMADTAFLRSDELPARTALGYLVVDGEWRSNVFHLPVRGTGDGGAFTTVADLRALWRAFFAGEIVSADWVREMVRPRSDVPSMSRRYGLGFWLHASTDTVMLEGCDAGVSCLTVHVRDAGVTHSVISNTTDGAWPIARFLAERLG